MILLEPFNFCFFCYTLLYFCIQPLKCCDDGPELSALQDLAPADSGCFTITRRVFVINCSRGASAVPLNKQLAVSCQISLDCRPLLVDRQKTRSLFFLLCFLCFILNKLIICLFYFDRVLICAPTGRWTDLG